MLTPETLTADEVRAIAPGDEMCSAGLWFTILSIDEMGTAVNGDPVCHFYAELNGSAHVRWSGYAHPGTVRANYRRAAASIAQAAE